MDEKYHKFVTLHFRALNGAISIAAIKVHISIVSVRKFFYTLIIKTENNGIISCDFTNNTI